ncbi:MAG: hypothetical protein Q9182_005484 [Xanthomendoza sp. 2 TL-2023]
MRWAFIRQISSLQLKPQGPLQPTTNINVHQETILLYRALLRQCTYLPDSAARKYMWSHVVQRFHAYFARVKLGDGRTILRKRQTLDEKKLSEVLGDARKSLKYLQRANDGHIQHLRTVLDMTYGRVGKRRRLLISKLQAPDFLVDDVALAVFSAKMSQNRKTPGELPFTDELAALLKSQVKQDSDRFNKPPVREIAPKVPSVNVWQRKFPQKRRDNFIRAWYAKTLDRLMPPLDADEWERLQGLALGTIPWDGPVFRRKLGTSDAKVPLDAITHVVRGDIPYRLTSSTDRVVDKGRHPETGSTPHELTPRFMRKLWTAVFEKCPRLDWNHEWKKWDVTWGTVEKQLELVLDTKKRLPLHLFDGVDEHGKIRQAAVEPFARSTAEKQ